MGMHSGTATLEKQFDDFLQNKHSLLPYNPAIVSFIIYPKKLKA